MLHNSLSVFLKTLLISVFSFYFLTYLSSTHILNDLKKNTKTIVVNDIEISFREYGNDNEKDIVFLHGFAGSSHDWTYIIENISDKYHCIAIDIPPFGLSEKAMNFDYSDLSIVKTIIDLLDSLGIERFTLVGHSMGGYLSILMASMYPERIEKLVLFDAAYPIQLTSSESISESGNVNTKQSLGSNEGQFLLNDKVVTLYKLLLDVGLKTYPAFKIVYKNTLTEGELLDNNHFDYLFAQNYFLPSKVLIKFSKDKSMQRTLQIDLAKVNAETLIIYGEKDNITPVKIGEFLSKNIKNSKFVIIPDEGHMPLSSSIAVRALKEFLSR